MRHPAPCLAVLVSLMAGAPMAWADDARAQVRAALEASLNEFRDDPPEQVAAIAACAEEFMSDTQITALLAATNDGERAAVMEAAAVPSPEQLVPCAQAKVAGQ